MQSITPAINQSETGQVGCHIREFALVLSRIMIKIQNGREQKTEKRVGNIKIQNTKLQLI